MPAPQKASDPGLQTVAEQGGFVDAYVGYCMGANSLGASGYTVQMQGWEQRNHWEDAKTRIANDPALQHAFQNAKLAEQMELNRHRFKSTLSCTMLARTLRNPAHDPSATQKAANAPDLMGMDQGANGGGEGRAKKADAAPSMLPEPVHTQPSPAATATASTATAAAGTTASSGTAAETAHALGVAQPVSGAGAITVGAMTVTPPPGWTVQKNTPEAAILKTQTQHTAAVILLTTVPLSGSPEQALYSGVRANFPGTGLTFKYPHSGTTGGGSPAIYVLDSGVVNRQREDIAAVGYAIGGKLQMALLISGDWGGENIKFRNQLDDMMSAAVLHGDGSGTWDPLHPEKMAGGRSGLFFGSALQNQLNPLGGMDLVARREYVVLLPTGQAYFGLPEGGHVLDLNFAEACHQAPKKCGTYKLEGGTLTFTERDAYGLVTHTSSPFTAGEPGHSIIASYHSTRAFEVLPVHGKTLAGKYTSTFAQTGNIGGSHSVVAQTFISFTPNGSYQKSGFSSASFQTGSAGATTMSNRGLGSGQYKFDGYTLTLTPSSGEPELYTAVFENQDPDPKAVFINDKAFLKDGR